MLEFREKFIEEALELVGSVETELMVLEANPNDRTVIDKVFRTMHTIKGASGMYGFDKIMEITHELETLFASKIFLDLIVKVEPNWTKTDRGLSRVGLGESK